MTIKVPGQPLRQFFLGCEDHIAHDDELYYLVFSRSGGMFVQIFYSPNKQYASARWGQPIYPADFGNHSIDGTPLDQVVLDYLDSKLPKE